MQAERTTVRLVASGLDLIERVRIAYTDLAFAVDRQALAAEFTRIKTAIAAFEKTRLAHGAASESRALSARIEEQAARQQELKFEQEIQFSQDRLANLLGIA